MEKIKKHIKYTLRLLVWFIAFYLSLSSFILVKIVTNDILLKSYNFYTELKLWGWKVSNIISTSYQKSKLLFDKYLHKDKYNKYKEDFEEKKKEKKEELNKLKKELEFNKFILSGLPYVIFVIVFIFTYSKILKKSEELIENIIR